jgi:hypothetical protein
VRYISRIASAAGAGIKTNLLFFTKGSPARSPSRRRRSASDCRNWSRPSARRGGDLRDRLTRRLLRQGVGDLLFRETLLHANLQAGWRPKCPR